MFVIGVPEVIILIVIASATWVYFDAKSIGAKRGLTSGFLNMGPIGWAMSTILLWIICFPLYLVKRDDIRSVAAGDESPQITFSKPTAANTAAKVIGLGWSILCFLGVVIGLVELGSLADQYSGSGAEAVGLTIGTGLGLGFWFFLWVVIAGPATGVFFLTRKPNTIAIIQDPQQAAASNSKKCPYCAEVIKEEANFCRFCKQSLITQPQDSSENKASINMQTTQESVTTKAPVWLDDGKRLLREENNKEAIATLTRYLETAPADGEGFYFRAIAFSRMKDKKKMAADLKKAARLGNKKAQEALAKMASKTAS